MNDIMPASSGDTHPAISLSQFSAKDRELLAAVFEHETVNLFIHLDDCEDDACPGCDPQHLAEKAAAEDVYAGHHKHCYIREGAHCSCGGAR